MWFLWDVYKGVVLVILASIGFSKNGNSDNNLVSVNSLILRFIVFP